MGVPQWYGWYVITMILFTRLHKIHLLKHYSTSLPSFNTKLLTVPNILTLTRLAAAPAIGYCIVNHTPTPAVGLMVYASITDFLDGFIARKTNSSSVLGSILDPAADKALMITLSTCLTASQTIPWWCGLSIFSRDALLLLAALKIRFSTLPKPRTLSKFVNMKIQTVNVRPNKLSKWNTFFQMVYLTSALVNSAYFVVPDQLMTGGAVFVTGTTIASGISYIFSKTAVSKLKL